MTDRSHQPLNATMVKKMTAKIAGELDRVHAARAEQGRTRLRRLNAFEYRNTIRDLLHLNVDSFDPTGAFPPDEEHDGFTNLGGTLVLSDHLLEKCLEAAAQSQCYGRAGSVGRGYSAA